MQSNASENAMPFGCIPFVTVDSCQEGLRPAIKVYHMITKEKLGFSLGFRE